MIQNTNDGTDKDPYLRFDLNYWNSHDLPDFSAGPHQATDLERHQAIKDAGYSGVQDGDPEICEKLGLRLTSQYRVNKVGDLDEKIEEWSAGPYDCATVHVGWGMESDAEADALVAYVIGLTVKYDFPVYIETHRATITQDMQRIVELTKRFPEIRFNGDLSHWYTGLEMVNGDFADKLAFIAPVLERVRFIHGRISNPGSIQVDIGDGTNQVYVDHFREIWKRCFIGFLKTAEAGDYLCFTPELLPSEYYYARLVKSADGELVEEGDRWQQALLLTKIARECWDQVNMPQ